MTSLFKKQGGLFVPHVCSSGITTLALPLAVFLVCVPLLSCLPLSSCSGVLMLLDVFVHTNLIWLRLSVNL